MRIPKNYEKAPQADESPLFEDGYFEEIGIKIYQKFPNWQQKHKSLVENWQIAFLQGLISDYKFTNGEKIKNVLEIGVYNGVTSLYMLKTGLSCRSDFEVYGIDIGETELFGGAVFSESSVEEQKHYHLHLGCSCFDMETIVPQNTKFDVVFIDAGHSHPHPLFDLIHSIPFLHDESVCLFHDVVNYMRPNAWGESFIFTGWTDKKYQTVRIANGEKRNISGRTSLGAIKIPKNKDKLYENIRLIAKIPFRASPWKFSDDYLGVEVSTLDKLKRFMTKYYDQNFAKEIYEILKENLEEYRKNWILYFHETKFFNQLFESEKSLKKNNENLLINNETLQRAVLFMDKKIKFLEEKIELLENKLLDKNL